MSAQPQSPPTPHTAESPSADRRRSPRRDVRLNVHFEPRGRAAAPPRAAETSNAGPEGLFIATRRPPARGTRLFVEAFLDDVSEPPVGLECVVRWRRRFREPRGMGVAIVGGSQAALARFGRWLAAVTPGVTPSESVALRRSA